MRILLIVGMPCSGKTIVTKTAKELGIFTLSTGDIVREEIKKRGLPYTEKTDREVREWFYEYGRERQLMRIIIDKIIGAKHPDPIVIEGLRSPKQIDELKKRLWGEKVSIMAVHSPPEIRWKRERTRPRFDNKGYRNVKQRDQIELSHGLSDLIALSDYILVNNGSLDRFKKTVKDKLIEILNISEKRWNYGWNDN